MDLYTQTALKCSKLVTEHYSTSFTLGIKTLDKKYHLPVYAVYGYVRYADEIVDTFHDHDKAALLQKFRLDTYEAIEQKISLNPILHAFQLVVRRYKIERELIDAFLHSMEMDLDNANYDKENYQEYIYGSAEVVGLMCLRIFCEGDENGYDTLKGSARRLGAAFQKVNFLRDIRSDFDDRGRVYFPGVDFENFKESDKKQIEADIALDFEAALIGIRGLPKGAKRGVYLAYVYYQKLFRKIQQMPPSKIMSERVRIPDALKMLLLSKTLFLGRLKSI